jgi:hypothetical protein
MESQSSGSVGNPLGISAMVNRLSTVKKRSRGTVQLALTPYAISGYLRLFGLKKSRLVRSLALPVDPLGGSETDLPSIDVAVPCGPNDIAMLPVVLDRVKNGSTNPIARKFAVVPPRLLSQAQDLAGDRFTVVDEALLLGPEVLDLVMVRFPTRSNWVVQQLVKVAFVLQSEAPGVLILDADTMLLKPRTWLTSRGVQVLTPTMEWHQDYYNFLRTVSPPSWPGPRYSFVPHHMLMQPDVLRSVMEQSGLRELHDLVQALGCETDYPNQSMFCIEYELYAQGMLAIRPEDVALAKWSNIGVRRTPDAIAHSEAVGDFMSVSLHHYLD